MSKAMIVTMLGVAGLILGGAASGAVIYQNDFGTEAQRTVGGGRL